MDGFSSKNYEFYITVSEDSVPFNLDEAVDSLKQGCGDSAISWIKSNNPTSCHFGFGTTLRNKWSLWDKETKLVKWFESEYGINHADDISSVILDSLWRDINNQPRRPRELSERSLKYWKTINQAVKERKQIELEIKNGEMVDCRIVDNKTLTSEKDDQNNKNQFN